MQIRFDGPPGPTSGRFIEVEDERGRGIKVGRWVREGTDWLLVIPEDQNLREAVRGALVELDAFLEDDDNDPMAFAERGIPQVADRLRFALNPMVLHRCQKDEPCGECGRPRNCVCHPAHLKEVIIDESRDCTCGPPEPSPTQHRFFCPKRRVLLEKRRLRMHRASGSIGEKLDNIIAEASAFSEFNVHTDDAFRLIVKLAHDIDNQLEDRLCPSQDPNGECNAVNEAIGRAEDAEASLARSVRLSRSSGERGYAEEGRRWNKERLDHVTAQLSALHDEFRAAAQRLKFTANWLTYTFAKGSADAQYARRYADIAKEVLDKGLDWLVERNRNRGRGVMDSTAASKSAGEGSSPSARARPEMEQRCMGCCHVDGKGMLCLYASWSTDYIWFEVKRRLEQLAGSDDVVWNANERRAIQNLMWHYSQRGV